MSQKTNLYSYAVILCVLFVALPVVFLHQQVTGPNNVRSLLHVRTRSYQWLRDSDRVQAVARHDSPVAATLSCSWATGVTPSLPTALARATAVPKMNESSV